MEIEHVTYIPYLMLNRFGVPPEPRSRREGGRILRGGRGVGSRPRAGGVGSGEGGRGGKVSPSRAGEKRIWRGGSRFSPSRKGCAEGGGADEGGLRIRQQMAI